MITRKILAIGLMGMALLVSGCASSAKDDIHWSVRVAAPKHYEVWVKDMFLEKPGERTWRQPIGSISCCWKGPNGPSGAGSGLEPFPESIFIYWFSYAEQKFYAKLIKLPPDLQNRMREHAPYKTSLGEWSGPRHALVIGLAPGGTVVVWIMNQIGNEIEVMRLKAAETDGDSSQFTERTKGYLERNGEYLEKHGVPTEGW